MILETEDQVGHYIASLRPAGGASRSVVIERLSGGVSCSVWKVTAGAERWVVKQALPKLAVEVDWFADVQRIEREQQAMLAVEPHMPAGTVPRILHSDADNHLYIMTCAPEEAVTWKSQLMNGEFRERTARHAGEVLRIMHECSRRELSPEQQGAFEDLSFFRELRIEPFHQYLLMKHPHLTAEMNTLIADLLECRTCLVHGDFSPKNLLVDRHHQVIVLDYEVAHWGNPVFDLAFTSAHLLLKGWALHKQADAFRLMHVFLQAYGYRHERESRLTGHTGALLLARIDGKSTVDYIKDPVLKERIRKQATDWIRHPDREPFASLDEAMKG
ncbi:phosphotransferase family protein [Paenibacillus koleovorans]|uniref:phosphotransferase family protein n=1 Tax=Paenibacillus koleovorans TaxID=121608 RepID=UPI0013E2E65A|nr:aminoglycoside phosphotransferase family protein [Paenibacillus koleovorans]